MSVVNLQSRRTPDLVLEANDDPLIPPGDYELAYVGHAYLKMFRGRHKLVMSFRVITQGPHFDTILRRYYNVEKQGRSYRAPRSGALNREFTSLFGKRSARQGVDWDRLSRVIVLGEVATVKVDAQSQTLDEVNQYSRISNR